MKRFLLIALTGALLLCFSACKIESTPTTTQTTTAAPTETTTQPSTAPSTTEAQSTTEQQADIAFIYNGFWYKNEGSKVLALQFGKDGSLTVNTYRRKSLTSASSAPDSVIYGSFKDNGDGTLYVYPDNEFLEEFYVYTADAENKTLTCENDDPQASTLTRIELMHFDTLSKENARKALATDN